MQIKKKKKGLDGSVRFTLLLIISLQISIGFSSVGLNTI